MHVNHNVGFKHSVSENGQVNRTIENAVFCMQKSKIQDGGRKTGSIWILCLGLMTSAYTGQCSPYVRFVEGFTELCAANSNLHRLINSCDQSAASTTRRLDGEWRHGVSQVTFCSRYEVRWFSVQQLSFLSCTHRVSVQLWRKTTLKTHNDIHRVLRWPRWRHCGRTMTHTISYSRLRMSRLFGVSLSGLAWLNQLIESDLNSIFPAEKNQWKKPMRKSTWIKSNIMFQKFCVCVGIF